MSDRLDMIETDPFALYEARNPIDRIVSIFGNRRAAQRHDAHAELVLAAIPLLVAKRHAEFDVALARYECEAESMLDQAKARNRTSESRRRMTVELAPRIDAVVDRITSEASPAERRRLLGVLQKILDLAESSE